MSNSLKVYAKLEANFQLTNKCTLFYNMRRYYLASERDPYQVLPLTYHVKSGTGDPEFTKFVNYYQEQDALKQQAVKEEKDISMKLTQAEKELASAE